LTSVIGAPCGGHASALSWEILKILQAGRHRLPRTVFGNKYRVRLQETGCGADAVMQETLTKWLLHRKYN
jgi:hypothetical protein